MPRLFGTDGIRGVVGADLTVELAFKVGRAAASMLREARGSPLVLTCRDTRPTGPTLEMSLISGMVGAGARVARCGILPTPAIAFLLIEEGADAGVVISASHNPPNYNGIKFFDSSGNKLPDSQEEEIEARLDSTSSSESAGEEHELASAEDRYVKHALDALEGRHLGGIKVVVDCGFGASFSTSPRALREAGAEVIAVNDEPEGNRINVSSGSTHPEVVARAVLEHSADAGIAHDGDADRVIAVDEKGNIVDGDPMLAALAIELKEQGRLPGERVVATVMANLGFRQAMSKQGIAIVETPVGDRYVSDALRKHGANVGGEQSGHLIFPEFATTGDGLITALRLLGRMSATGQSLSELAAVVEKFPQVLLNVSVSEPQRVQDAPKVHKALEEAEYRLGTSGRVLVRASGTEPLVRVMVEAEDEATARSVAEELAQVVTDELGGGAGTQSE